MIGGRGMPDMLMEVRGSQVREDPTVTSCGRHRNDREKGKMIRRRINVWEHYV
jgi:hypothetical protein